MLGWLRRSLQLAAQIRDVGFDDVGVVFPVVVVEMLQQLPLRDDHPRPVNQVLQDAILRGRQIDRLPERRTVCSSVFTSRSGETQDGVGDAFAAADERLGPGDQFAQVEGFAEVVVGAGVEQGDDGAGLGLGGQDEHRALRSPRARTFFSTLRPSSPGQHEVEDEQVIAAVFCQVEAGEAVFGAVDREVGTLAQGGRHVLCQPHLVFDQ